MFCNQCGAKLPDSARFCTRCGAPVGGAPTGAIRTNTLQPGTEGKRLSSELKTATFFDFEFSQLLWPVPACIKAGCNAGVRAYVP